MKDFINTRVVHGQVCEKHRPKKLLGGGDGQQKGLQQTWKSIKSAATNIKDNVKNTVSILLGWSYK